MKKLLLFVLFSAIAAAQQRTPVASMQPDCMVTFNFTAISSGAQAAGTVNAGSTGTTAVIDNRTDAGCLDWLVTYSTTTGISALSLLFQTATNANGVPGTWSTYGGTLSSGINPNTAATPPWAVTDATGTKYPFLRMNLTALTGSGTVSGNLYGWKRRPAYVVATIAPGTICTAAAPCPVDGPTAAGSPPVFPPVMVAGQDGTNIRTVRTDTAGNQTAVGPDASGAASATNPVQVAGSETGGTVRTLRTDNVGILASVRTTTAGDAIANTAGGININGTGGVSFLQNWPFVFNGTTWDRTRGNTLGAFVQGPAATGTAVASAGNPVIVGGFDGTLSRTLRLGDTGGIIPQTVVVAQTDAVSNTVHVWRSFTETTGALNRGYYTTLGWVFNGTAWDRYRSASLANMSPAVTPAASIGALQVENGSRFPVVSSPAADAAASASIAALASNRHVAACVTFSAVSTGAVTAANVSVNLRDGATGAGTVLWTYLIAVPTAAAAGVQVVPPQHICGLNYTGTTNTAMTFEFSAGVTNVQQTATLGYYNVN